MANEMNCTNCNQAYGSDDMFCENCGYDFLTGTMPPDLDGIPAASPIPSAAGEGSAGSGESAEDETTEQQAEESKVGEEGGSEAVGTNQDSSSETGDVLRTRFEISVDRPFFDQVVTGGEIDYPDEPVPTQTLEIAGDEIHIGRASESRAIHPDLDIAELTEDQAVSSRHAVVRVVGAGKFQLVDVGSTNGTFIESPASEPINQGEPLDLEPGMPFYVGAWTRLTVLAE